VAGVKSHRATYVHDIGSVHRHVHTPQAIELHRCYVGERTLGQSWHHWVASLNPRVQAVHQIDNGHVQGQQAGIDRARGGAQAGDPLSAVEHEHLVHW